jgi:hypothetical protein
VGADLRAELETWAANRGLGDTPVDVQPIHDRLEGRAETLWEMFAAIVAVRAGDAGVIGEKTPDHLQWWQPLTTCAPWLRLIAVVRDPRAVVASLQQVPFGRQSHALNAEAWRSDQRILSRAWRTLGADRMLWLRYEDVVSDETATRKRIAEFLCVPDVVAGTATGRQDLALDWEAWKQRATAPATTERLEAWRGVLSASQAADIVAICRRGMQEFAYPDWSSSTRAAVRTLRLGVRTNVQRARFRLDRHKGLRFLQSDKVLQALRGA